MVMWAGRLDRQVTIQRRTVVVSDSGAVSDSWSNLASPRSASVRPASGAERYRDPSRLATDEVEFQLRWSPDIADLSPTDRIIYPALSDDSPGDVPDTRRVYNILAVMEIGRTEGLQVLTKRQPDVGAGE